MGKNSLALGARVEITAGDKKVLRQLSGGRGYLSQASARITAGVGHASEVSIKVYWPDGTATESAKLPVNATHMIRQE